jgi:hypothetical protein
MPLLPVFDAVINSIESISDLGITSGKIEIHVIRENNPILMEDKESRSLPRILSFIIKDNGMGFTSENLKSFFTSESRKKISIGGKGIGRFLWLKAFKKVMITSNFKENGKFNNIEFEFSETTENPPVPLSIRPCQQETTISLIGLKETIYNLPLFPKTPDTIAERIIDHCFEYFARGIAPEIVIFDSEINEPINLNLYFSEMIDSYHAQDGVDILGIPFTILHYLAKARPHSAHTLNLCANKRATEKIKIYLPNLEPVIEKDGFKLIYSGFVLSTFLDQSVTSDRTLINFDSENSSFVSINIDKNSLIETIKLKIAEFLTPFTEAQREQKGIRIKSKINENLPYYRPFLDRHPEVIDRISMNASSSEIDLEFYKLQKEIEINTHKEIDLISKSAETLPTKENIDKLSTLYSEFNEIGKTNLAKYLTQRMSILDILNAKIRFTVNQKFEKEEALHEIIFPLKSTSDEIPFQDQNLWIIDEKLSYHHYLASDKPFTEIEPMESNALKRPDIVAFFNSAHAISSETNSFGQISIIEFKRPGRNDYQEKDNPIIQAYDYIDEISTSTRLDYSGRPMVANQNTLFYVYIICDITEKIIRFAINAQLKPTPDKQSYFGWSDHRNAIVQIISYDKLLADAQLRNKILFDILKGASYDWTVIEGAISNQSVQVDTAPSEEPNV